MLANLIRLINIDFEPIVGNIGVLDISAGHITSI